MNNLLIVIPARGGSKGIPGKNIKSLGGKPLICYSIDAARAVADDSRICVSTDDAAIISCVESYGLKVPFVRPDELATDTAGTNGVLLHALNFYESKGIQVDAILLLQPTSPFRSITQVKEILSTYTPDIDMVVSVKETSVNPYYNCFEDDEAGFLQISKGTRSFVRRQDAPPAYEFTGSLYVINPASLKAKGLFGLDKIRKYVTSDFYTVDLDTMFDWKMAELLLQDKLVNTPDSLP